MRARAAVAAILSLALLAAPAAEAKKRKTLDRPADPVVLTGSQLPRLLGATPSSLVAYSLHRAGKGKRTRWRRVPVQLDERALVDFGGQPPNNAQAGIQGTVYGTAPIGVAALQYTDPATFVGPDPDPGLDADDEVALMASDAGLSARKVKALPRGVAKGGATALSVTDPLTHARGWVYLFRAPKAKPLKTDYVSYSFRLASGDYRSSYRRADGPNPESSAVSTSEYRAGYSDRWFLDTLAIDAGAASGQDIVDGFKSGFAPGNCGRSEATYNDAEGAFVANIDGPVRAIRSYVGANSGPRTQRTDVFYRGRIENRIDLRVHPISSIVSYLDMAPGALGMTYRNSLAQGGVPVDGVSDSIPAALAAWHQWAGPQGTLFSATRLATSFPAQVAAGSVTTFYRDEQNTALTQCWGDDDLYGAAGSYIVPQGGIPNTDPAGVGAATLEADAVNVVTGPGGGAAQAGELFRQGNSPLAARASKFKPKR